MEAFVFGAFFLSCGEGIPEVPEMPNDKEPIIEIDNESTAELPFKRGAEGYAFFRIPAMVVSKEANILAFAEGRVNSRDDAGDIDIVLKRSADGGQTWDDLIVVVDDGENRVGNPVPVVIPTTGRILLLYNWNLGHCCNDRKIFMTHSDDDGLTWADKRDITSMVKTADMGEWYATGPCHGIVKQRGEHTGRIIVPANFGRDMNGRSMLLYSDDNGDTWHIGAKSSVPSNESTVVELSNGDVILNMRNAPGATERNRISAISKDGGLTFSTPFYDEQLTEPLCQASMLFHSIDPVTNKGILLFSNPPGTSNRRGNALKLSMDDGENWIRQWQYVPSEETGGYSDIAVLGDGKVAILHELGYLNSVGIGFKKVELDDLK